MVKQTIYNLLHHIECDDIFEVGKILYDYPTLGKDRNYFLEVAVRYASLELVNLLIEHGADINFKNAQAFQYAVSYGRVTFAQMFIDRGVKVDLSIINENLLIMPASWERTEILQFLLENGHRIEKNDSALLSAIENYHFEIVKLMIMYNAPFDEYIFREINFMYLDATWQTKIENYLHSVLALTCE